MKQYEADSLLEAIKSNSPVAQASFIVDSSPLEFIDVDDSIEFHAGRLLFLLRFAAADGKNGNNFIKGRTKLAKLDFFLRYPLYLEKALRKIGGDDLAVHLKERERQSIESTMIKYKYGPWDHKYYDIFAYLIAKGFMEIDSKQGVDNLKITKTGKRAISMLSQHESYQDIEKRCKIINSAFGRYSGTRLKNFIYDHFPEIVGLRLGSIIEGV